MSRKPSISLLPIFALIVFTAIFLALTVRVSFFASEGPDEVAHFYFDRFIAKYGRLPLTNEERSEAGYKADLPPLFYLLAGLTAQQLDLESGPRIRTTRNNPRLQLVAGLDNVKAWRMIKTEDPLQGEILLWYWGRWLTILTGLACLVATFVLLRRLFPDQLWLAVAGVALLGFLPGYIYISGITSYEPLAGFLMTLFLLLLLHTIRHPARSWSYLGLGLLLGLAALTRHTPWPVLPLVPLLIIWLAVRQGWSWSAMLGRIALFAVGVLVTFGSWVLYITLYFNRIDELGWFQGILSPLFIGDGSGTTSQQIASVITGGELGINDFAPQSDSFWQWLWISFSQVWGADWLGGVMLVVWVVAMMGLIRRWPRENDSTRWWIVLLLIYIPLLMALPFLRFVFSGNASSMMGQHILFTAGAAMVVLLIYGLTAWSPRSTYVTAGVLLVLAGLYLGRSVDDTFRRSKTTFPVQTVAMADEQPLATFDTITLLDYAVETDKQLLTVTLHWRAEANSPEDYRWVISLLNDEGQPQRRWIGQPLNGRYPTRAWLPGDRVRDMVVLPVVDLPPDDYHLQIQVLGELESIETAQRPPVALTTVALDPAPFTPGETVQLDGQTIGYTLWSSEKPDAVYQEYATFLLSTEAQNSDLKFTLIDPDGQSHPPIDHLGAFYTFQIEPNFVSGDYHVQVERWQADQLVAQAETPSLLHVETEPRQFTPGPITQPLDVNFAGYVTLLGYDLPKSHVQAGESLPVTLHWQARRTIGADLVMFSRLMDAEQNVRGGRDRLVREVYSTLLWASGEVVVDPFAVQVDADAPDGVYNLVIGLYLPVGESPVSLPLMQDGQMTDITSVTLGPITVGETPPKP